MSRNKAVQVAYKQTEAVVLRKVDFSETSLIVTLLSPDFGRLACLAKGARRKGSPVAASLDTFNRLELTFAWKDSRQVQNLIETSVLNSYGPIKRDILRSAAAAFVLDVALHASWDNHPARELYDALVKALEELSGADAEPRVSAARGVYALLEAAGIAPAPGDEESLSIPHGQGGAKWKGPGDALNCLRAGGGALEPGTAESLLAYLNDYAVYHLESPLKSYAFLKQVLRSE